VRVTPTSTADNIYVVVNAYSAGTVPNTQLFTGGSAPLSTRLQSFNNIENNLDVRSSLTTAQVFGVPSSAIANDINYSAGSVSPPPYEWDWTINYQVADNTTTNAVMGWIIEVEYTVEFWTPNTGGLADV
jgi:hypothetical protein